MSMSEESISVPSVVDEIVSDSEDGFSEYSTQSFDPDEMEEAPVQEPHWADIEQANHNGVSRQMFPKRACM